MTGLFENLVNLKIFGLFSIIHVTMVTTQISPLT